MKFYCSLSAQVKTLTSKITEFKVNFPVLIIYFIHLVVLPSVAKLITGFSSSSSSSGLYGSTKTLFLLPMTEYELSPPLRLLLRLSSLFSTAAGSEKVSFISARAPPAGGGGGEELVLLLEAAATVTFLEVGDFFPRLDGASSSRFFIPTITGRFWLEDELLPIFKHQKMYLSLSHSTQPKKKSAKA